MLSLLKLFCAEIMDLFYNATVQLHDYTISGDPGRLRLPLITNRHPNSLIPS